MEAALQGMLPHSCEFMVLALKVQDALSGTCNERHWSCLQQKKLFLCVHLESDHPMC